MLIIGFEKPSAIQQRAIRPLLKGRDVIAQAQSGTGKTATFSISILQSIDTTIRETQVMRAKTYKTLRKLTFFLVENCFWDIVIFFVLGIMLITNARISSSNSKSSPCAWGLYECSMPFMYRWY